MKLMKQTNSWHLKTTISRASNDDFAIKDVSSLTVNHDLKDVESKKQVSPIWIMEKSYLFPNIKSQKEN